MSVTTSTIDPPESLVIENNNNDNSPKPTATGPITDAGKAVSRGNALKHGLSGEGVVLPPYLADLVKERIAEWKADYQPVGGLQESFYVRYCTDAVLLDRCIHLQSVAVDELARRAFESWNDGRKLDAVILFAEFPKHPEIIQKRLLQTKQGCNLLIETWEFLKDQLKRHNRLTPEQRLRVFDLLGIPTDQRGEALPAHLLGPIDQDPVIWMQEQIDALKDRLNGHLDSRDAQDQLEAQAGLSFSAPSLTTLRRYEASIYRRMYWALGQLRALQKGKRPKPGSSSGSGPKADPSCPETTKSEASRPATPAPSVPAASSPARSSSSSSAFTPLMDKLAPRENRQARRAREALECRSH